MINNNEIYLIANGYQYQNLKSISLHASLEQLPRSFSISYIDDNQDNILNIGDSITIETKNDGTIFVGAIGENIKKSRSATNHSMEMSGRGAVKDLLDGSADIRSSQLPSTINLLAQFLCDSKGIQFKNYAKNSDTNNLTTALNVGCDESPFAILERAARYEAVIIYDSWLSQFIINDVSTAPVTTINDGDVTEVNFSQSISSRYYSYAVVRSQNSVAQEAGLQPIIDGLAYDPEKDQINSWRRLVIVNSQSDGSADYSQRLAEWYANRAYGKATVLEVVIPSWTYATGKPWDINMCVNVEIPGYYQTSVTKKPLLISEVTLSYSAQEGTEARLIMTFPEAFSPQPLAISQTARTNSGNNNAIMGSVNNNSDG